jgi:hypothetical protein
MNPFHHPDCNDVLRRPPGTTEAECGDLHIVREDGRIMSFWKPEPAELAAINEGGAIGLIVQGTTHPPVAIVACHPTEADRRPSKASLYDGLLAITKRAIALWTKNHLEDPDRRKITDELLDFLNGAPKPEVKAEPEPDGMLDWWKSKAETHELSIKELKAEENGTLAALDTERELRKAAEANIDNLFHYLEGRVGDVPISGRAVSIRDAIVRMVSALSKVREAVEEVTEQNPNHLN